MRPMRPSTLLLSCAIAGLVASAALAQAVNYTSVEATAGKLLQLTYHASAQKNCTPAPLATFDVLQAPKLGVLTVRKAMLTTNKVAGCPRLKIPAEVVFYRGREGSAGADHVVYKVTSSGGEVEVYDVTITLKPAPTPAPSPPSKQKGDSL
ncbi:MAG: hypothetical protein ABR973_16055 [Candidatus Acidiferrales bacterium]